MVQPELLLPPLDLVLTEALDGVRAELLHEAVCRGELLDESRLGPQADNPLESLSVVVDI